MRHVTGDKQIINNLFMRRSKVLRALAGAMEKTAVAVANHAKAGHAGDMAHANDRYQNRTTMLTRSITPELVKVDFNSVEAVVFSSIEYAVFVEQIYPYLFPALQANRSDFKRTINEAMRRKL